MTITVTDLTFGWFWNCQGKGFCLLVLLRGQDGLKLEICRSGNSWEELWSPQAGITVDPAAPSRDRAEGALHSRSCLRAGAVAGSIRSF